MKKELNEKEREVLGRISKAGPSGISITQLAADCFRTHGEIHPSRANSWVRNSLRRPVGLGMIHKTARGRYALGPGSGAPIAPAPDRPRAPRAKKHTTNNAGKRVAPQPKAPRLSVQDFGPIASADIELGDLTVLVGPEPEAKSLFVQCLKMALDASEVVHSLKEAGRAPDSEEALLDQVFGGGMHSAWRDGQTSVLLNGKRVSPAAWLKLRRTKDAQPAEVFFVPSQRALLLADDKLGADAPVAARLFSRHLHDHLSARGQAVQFPPEKLLEDQCRILIDRAVFRGGSIELDGPESRNRLRLVFEKGTRLPFMTWTAGQRELTPLLLGLYHLLAPRKARKLAHVDSVVVEEPELGLSPQGVAAFMLVVLDLLWRGYRVVLSTHSPVILDIVSGLRSLIGRKGASRMLAEAFGMQDPDSLQKVMQRALECTHRVYLFERDRKTNQVSARDISERQAEWNTLAAFTPFRVV